MELAITAHTQLALVLGHDLQLVVERTGQVFAIRALDGNGTVLQMIAEVNEPPSDGVLAIARATAIMLHGDRIDPPAAPPPEPPPIRSHPYERGQACKVCGEPPHSGEDHAYQRGWGCKHCPFENRHHIHDKSARTGAAT